MPKLLCLLAVTLSAATAFHLAPPLHPGLVSVQHRTSSSLPSSRRSLHAQQPKKLSLRNLLRPKQALSWVVTRARDTSDGNHGTEAQRNKTLSQLLASTGLALLAFCTWQEMFLGWTAFMVVTAVLRYMLIISKSTLSPEVSDDIGRLAMSLVPWGFTRISSYQTYLSTLGMLAVSRYDAAWAFIALSPTLGAFATPSMMSEGGKFWRPTIGLLAQVSQEIYYRGIMWKVGAPAGHPLWLLIAETTFWQALTKTATEPLNYPRLTVGNFLPLIYRGVKLGLLRWVSGSPTLPVLIVALQEAMARFLPAGSSLREAWDENIGAGGGGGESKGTSWLGEGRENKIREITDS